MRPSEVFYGDMHWHTHFSDNRDRASVEQMVRTAARYGLSILGTGDHNHNLTAATWQREREETDALRRTLQRQHSQLVVLNNCEMTFMLGHFLVFEPPHVDGTIAEAYQYLYAPPPSAWVHRSPSAPSLSSIPPVTMINHPGLPTDQWSTRIIPGAGAVEAINGSVMRDAAARGIRFEGFQAPVAVPMLSVFGRYAACGLPVAALGSSDAHRLRELGFGATGFLLSGPPTMETVLGAIRRRRTFAVTDTGIELRWEVFSDPGGGDDIRLAWTARFGTAPGRPDIAPADDQEIHSWLYRGLIVASESVGHGGATLLPGHLYWIVARAGSRFAVSSIIIADAAGGESEQWAAGSHPIDPDVTDGIHRAATLIMRDLACRDWTPQSSGPQGSAASPGEPVSFLCEAASPIIRDALGHVVPFEVVRHERVRRIIDKEGPLADFDEFDVWLARNEVHECRFEALSYRREGNVFCLDAALVPVLSDRRRGAAERYRAWIAPMRKLLAGADRLRIRVGMMPTTTVRVSPGRWTLPFTVTDSVMHLSSELHEVTASPGLYEFPESWLPIVGNKVQRFVAQFFTGGFPDVSESR